MQKFRHLQTSPLISCVRILSRYSLIPGNQICYDHCLTASNKLDSVLHHFQNERSKAGKAQFERSRPLVTTPECIKSFSTYNVRKASSETECLYRKGPQRHAPEMKQSERRWKSINLPVSVGLAQSLLTARHKSRYRGCRPDSSCEAWGRDVQTDISICEPRVLLHT